MAENAEKGKSRNILILLGDAPEYGTLLSGLAEAIASTDFRVGYRIFQKRQDGDLESIIASGPLKGRAKPWKLAIPAGVTEEFISSIPSGSRYANVRKIASYFRKMKVNPAEDQEVAGALSDYGGDHGERSYYQMVSMMRFHDLIISTAEKGGDVTIIPFLTSRNAVLYDYIRNLTASKGKGAVEFLDVSEEKDYGVLRRAINENIISRLSDEVQKTVFDPDYHLKVSYEYGGRTHSTVREGIEYELASAVKKSRKLGGKALSVQDRIDIAFRVMETAAAAQKPIRNSDGKAVYPIDFFRDSLVLEASSRSGKLIKGLYLPVLEGGISMWKAYRNYMNDRLASDPLYRNREGFSLTRAFEDTVMASSGERLQEVLLGEYLFRGVRDTDPVSDRTLRIMSNISSLFASHPDLCRTFSKMSAEEQRAMFDLSGNPVILPDKGTPLYERCLEVKQKAERNRVSYGDAWTRMRFFSKYPEFNPLAELTEPVSFACRDERGKTHRFVARSLYACMAIPMLRQEGPDGRSAEELRRAGEIASGGIAAREWFRPDDGKAAECFEKSVGLLSGKNASWRRNVQTCRSELPENGEAYVNRIYSTLYPGMKDVKSPVDVIVEKCRETDRQEELKIVREMERLHDSGLTESQMKCVSSVINSENGKRNRLILAGPGSGKTRVLVRTVYELMKKGVRPENIIMFTFTNNAADEFASRLRLLMDSDENLKGKRMPSVSTAHSYALKILRDNYRQAGLPENFRTAETRTILSCIGDSFREILKPSLRRKEDSCTENSRRMIEFISKIKAQGLCGIPSLDSELEKNPDFIRQIDEAPLFSAWREPGAKTEIFRKCYEIYQNTLRENGLIDLSDIMIKSVSLLVRNREVREGISRNLSYLLVDEIQDANVLLLQLMSAVSGDKTNIVGAGDVNQNIYRYMNSGKYSDGRSIVQFLCDDPVNGFTKLYLTENLRSTAEIVRFANGVKRMTETADSEYESEAGMHQGEILHGEKPAVYISSDTEARWDWSLRKAEAGLNKEGETTMILCRTNRELQDIRDYARKHYPEIRFADRSNGSFSEAHGDVIAVLGYLSNPSSAMNYGLLIDRIASASPYDIPKPDLSGVNTAEGVRKAYLEASPESAVILDAVDRGMRNVTAINTDRHGDIKAHEAMGIFMSALTDDEGKSIRKGGTGTVNYHGVCGEYYMSEAAALISDIELKREEQRYGNAEISDSFVYLMTIHGSKGLEADNVILPNITPARSFSSGDVDSSNEDLKVLYTGITRGRKTVSVCAENEKFIRNLDRDSYMMDTSSQKVVEVKNSSELFSHIAEDDDDDWVQAPETAVPESRGPLSLKDLMASPGTGAEGSVKEGLSSVFSPKAVIRDYHPVRGKVKD